MSARERRARCRVFATACHVENVGVGCGDQRCGIVRSRDASDEAAVGNDVTADECTAFQIALGVWSDGIQQ
jgi:hypothetical protein